MADFAIISVSVKRIAYRGMGEVPEWTNGAVSKTVVALATTVG